MIENEIPDSFSSWTILSGAFALSAATFASGIIAPSMKSRISRR